MALSSDLSVRRRFEKKRRKNINAAQSRTRRKAHRAEVARAKGGNSTSRIKARPALKTTVDAHGRVTSVTHVPGATREQAKRIDKARARTNMKANTAKALRAAKTTARSIPLIGAAQAGLEFGSMLQKERKKSKTKKKSSKK